jgi:hypothetical protein
MTSSEEKRLETRRGTRGARARAQRALQIHNVGACLLEAAIVLI